jgi:hypothetical protein
MDHASTINFLSNEDTQELAPGFFMLRKQLPRGAHFSIADPTVAGT